MTTDLDAGRELDEKVARLVWPERRWLYLYSPHYSTDVAAAMTLLDTLAERGWSWDMTHYHGSVSPYEVSLWRMDGNDNDGACGARATLPLTICAAVLAALEGA
jgi:predicted transposase YdaD